MSPVLASDDLISDDEGLKYWSSISPDVNGMLGGYPQISRVDLRGSKTYLAKLRRLYPSTPEIFVRGADCGAGIGRITKGLLTAVCSTVDVIEPVEKFADVVEGGEEFEELRKSGHIGTVFKQGLQDWAPDAASYDLIWNQWCLGHLTDTQLIAYLQRCRAAVKPDGWIIVKENNQRGPEDHFDDVDSSVTRCGANS